MRVLFFAQITVIALVCLSSPAQAWTRDQAQQIATDRLEVAFKNIYRHVFSCQAQGDDCGTDRAEQIILHHIRNETLFYQGASLEFVSEQEQPNFFFLDGAVRIAKTSPTRGSIIYINLDLIAQSTGDDVYEPISYANAVALLVHEYGHHQETEMDQEISHEALDILGGKIKLQIERYQDVETVSDREWQALGDGATVSLEHYRALGSQGQYQEMSILLLTGSFGVIDVSKSPVSLLTCPRAYYRDELEFEGNPFAMYLATSQTRFEVLDANTLEFVLEIESANVWCLSTLTDRDATFQVFDRYRNGLLRLRLTAQEAELVFDESATQFNMTTPPDSHYY